MTANFKLGDRLSILREGDRFSKWNSLDDERVCNICERKFKRKHDQPGISPALNETVHLSSIF